MITASSLARRLACPSSDALPRAETYSPYAEAGRIEHADLSHLESLPDDLRRLLGDGARSEVKLAYDVATRAGRLMGVGEGRAYGSVGPFEIVGTADVIFDDGDTVTVIDWKGGADVEPAASNPQLLFYALAACRALDRDTACIVIAYTKTHRVDRATVGPIELADFANRLERMHVAVSERQASYKRGETLSTVEGPHCLYCPSKHVCPSKNALLVQISSNGIAALGESTLSLGSVRAAYHRLQSIKQIVKEADSRLSTFVDENGPIDLGDGRMYGRYLRKGNEELDGNVAATVIRKQLGETAQEFEAIAIERSTSKAAITRAAKAVAPVGGATRLADSIVKQIRAAGGASYKPSTRPLGEYRKEREQERDDDGNAIAEANRMLGAP